MFLIVLKVKSIPILSYGESMLLFAPLFWGDITFYWFTSMFGKFPGLLKELEPAA
jgi:hypothetical protein